MMVVPMVYWNRLRRKKIALELLPQILLSQYCLFDNF